MKKLASLSVALLFVLVGLAGMARTANAAELKVVVSGNVTISDFSYACQGAVVTGVVNGISPLEFNNVPFAKTNGGGHYAFDKMDVTYTAGGGINVDVHAEWHLIMFDHVQIDFAGDVNENMGDPVGFNTYNLDDMDIELSVYNAQVI